MPDTVRGLCECKGAKRLSPSGRLCGKCFKFLQAYDLPVVVEAEKLEETEDVPVVKKGTRHRVTGSALPWRPVITEGAGARFMTCPGYTQECMQLACALDLQDFHCEGCPGFQQRPGVHKKKQKK
jgi:hypothetical protein